MGPFDDPEVVADPAAAAEARAALGALIDALRRRGLTVAVAESCTGGLFCKYLTDVPGSSAYVAEGLVTYSNVAKERRLGVPAALIESHGAVSEPVAAAMALGLWHGGGADLAGAISGIAGPDGGTPDKPVGTVAFAVVRDGTARTALHRLDGNRATIRERACAILATMLTAEAAG